MQNSTTRLFDSKMYYVPFIGIILIFPTKTPTNPQQSFMTSLSKSFYAKKLLFSRKDNSSDFVKMAAEADLIFFTIGRIVSAVRVPAVFQCMDQFSVVYKKDASVRILIDRTEIR